MAKSGKRPLVVFNIKKLRKLGDFLFKVLGIKQNIELNPTMFATPNPPMGTIETHVEELVEAEEKVLTRAPGSVASRDEKYDQVLDDVHTLQGYVQELADESADEQSATTIITTSGFDLKINGVRVKPPLEAKNTKVSGTIKLIAKAAASRASYNWQQSNDNGTTWADLPLTLKANTTVSGLTPGNRVTFRVRAITVDGTGNWTQPVSVIVL